MSNINIRNLEVFENTTFHTPPVMNNQLHIHGDTISASLSVEQSTGLVIDAYDTSDVNTKRNILLNTLGGNVGIGTTSPSSKVDILSPFNQNQPILNIDSIDPAVAPFNFDAIGLKMGAYRHYIGMDLNEFNFRAKGDSIYGGFNFFTGDGTTNALRITSGGNVGIGTTSPAAKLDVNGVIRNRNPSWNVWKVNQPDQGPTSIITYNTTKSAAVNCNMNLNSGRMTATVAGRYLVSFNTFSNNATTAGVACELYLRKNGTNYSRIYTTIPVTNYYTAIGTICDVIDLEVNDYIDIYISIGSIHGNDNATFSGFMIG